jgi:hypothetical protein
VRVPQSNGKVRLPSYPAELLEAPPDRPRSPAEAGDLFTALCLHYELIYPGESARETVALWAKLGRRLAEDFVPAYRVPKKRGRPSKPRATQEEIAEYIAAGGGVLARYFAEPYAQARFVLAVRAIASRQSDAFERLSGAMPSARNLRNSLPTRYRKLKTVNSLKAAWKKIPGWIRSDPHPFIPKPADAVDC